MKRQGRGSLTVLKSRVFAGWKVVAAVGLCAALLPTAYALEGEEKTARLSIEYGSRLTIGALPEFPYDGRGGGTVGTVTDNGDGTGALHFPGDSAEVPPLVLLSGKDWGVRVEIEPNDLVGEVDFCTGEVNLSFDASFVPVMFSNRRTPLSVVTELTTNTSSGDFVTLEGDPLEPLGDLHLVGVARVPRTTDFLVNAVLSLPTDAATDMNAHLDFPQGRFPCPGETVPENPSLELSLGKQGRLNISTFPQFRYDAKGASGVGHIESVDENGVAEVYIPGENLDIPPLEILPGEKGIGVAIETDQLAGTIDFCTGEVAMDFDATFTPYIFGIRWPTGISVVTALTTGVSEGFFTTVEGDPMDAYQDGFIVGVAQVPKTSDWFINWFLSLPTDAVAQLPFHIHVESDKPLCPAS